MKNMMKKALSVIIALAMIMVPMSVFAAAGDPIAVPSWEYCIYSGSTVTVGAGETIYFEIGTDGSTDVLPFIVEGTGDFDVTICTEDGAGAYLDGTPVSAVNGKVETTITGYESTYFYCAFAITNNSADSVDYTCTIDFPVGTQSNPYAVVLAVGGTAEVTVPAYGQYYIALALPAMQTEYKLTITGNTGFGYSAGMGMPMWDTNGTCDTTVAGYWSPTANFSVVNNTGSEQTYTLALVDVPTPLGSENNPDTLPMDTTVDQYVEGSEYWYTWTATEDGVLKIEMNNMLCSDGWTYKYENGDTVKHFSTGWDESDKNVCEDEVVAGDVIKFAVSIPDGDPYLFAYGSVIFTTSFTADATLGGDEGDEGDEGGEDIGGGDETLTGDNYILSDEKLVVGTNDYAVNSMYEYTLFMFEPSETGKYTLTTTDSLIGYLGGGTFYFADPSAETVASTSYEWECTSVGQGILVGVKANENSANITITREDLDETDEDEWVIYENTATLEEFEYEGDASALVPVDFEDEIIDNAVLGEDGFYHLNSVDGPILYANLNDSLMSLVTMVGNGKVSAVTYGPDGSVATMTNYTDAFMEYMNNACVTDVGAYLYPLTEDLIKMYKEVGADPNQGWYNEDGVIGTSEDGWMFACYYAETVPGGSNEGNEGGNVDDPEIPNTDYEVFAWAMAMMVATAAAGATIVIKKTKRVK